MTKGFLAAFGSIAFSAAGLVSLFADGRHAEAPSYFTAAGVWMLVATIKGFGSED